MIPVNHYLLMQVLRKGGSNGKSPIPLWLEVLLVLAAIGVVTLVIAFCVYEVDRQAKEKKLNEDAAVVDRRGQ